MPHNLKSQDKLPLSISRDPPLNTQESDSNKHPSMSQDLDKSQDKDLPLIYKDQALIPEKDIFPVRSVKLPLTLRDHQSAFPDLVQDSTQDKDNSQLSKLHSIPRDPQFHSQALDLDSTNLITILLPSIPKVLQLILVADINSTAIINSQLKETWDKDLK